MTTAGTAIAIGTTITAIRIDSVATTQGFPERSRLSAALFVLAQRKIAGSVGLSAGRDIFDGEVFYRQDANLTKRAGESARRRSCNCNLV